MGGGSTNWTTEDTDGQVMNSDTTEGAWHERTVDLTPFAGKAVNHLWITADAATPVGSWSILYGEIAIYSADGTVTPIYDRQPSAGLSYFTGGGETNTQAAAERSNTAADAETSGSTTTYYVADQIGSTRMLLAAGGWPVSSDTYYPYGVEQYPSGDTNHYKFTGKERDSESGNDYFGARYFGSSMGRFMSPDYSDEPDTVPYAEFENPQTLNLYTYGHNNPLTYYDPDGHDVSVCSINGAGGKTCNTINNEQYATAQKARAKQQKAAHTGLSVGVQAGGIAVAGVGKAAVGVTGTVNPVTAQYDSTTSHPNVAASASGGVIATAGSHVAGAPKQDRSSTILGAYAGFSGGFLISNAGNSQGLKQPSESISVDFGLGPGGSIQLNISNGKVNSVTIGAGFGYGFAITDINTGTAAAGTGW